MTALPLEMLLAFKYRPRRMKLQVYAEYKVKFKDRSEQLIEFGKEIEDKMKGGGRKARKAYNLFKQAVLNLESDYKKVETAYNDGGGSPFKHLFNLLYGIVALVLYIYFVSMFTNPCIWSNEEYGGYS